MKAKYPRIILYTMLVVGATFSQGCAKTDPAAVLGGGGSCSVVNGGFTTCFDYTGSGFTAATGQTACTNTNSGGATGTYSTSACTTTGRTGSCQLSAGQPAEQYIRYLVGYNDTTAGTACSGMSGTYTSG